MDGAVEECVLHLLIFLVHHITAASHSLQYITTGSTPGTGFPEYTVIGLVDGEQFVYYDSKIEQMIPKTEWMERNVSKDYWNRETDNQKNAREIFKADLDILMKRFDQTEGLHILQRRSGCELNDDGSTRGYFQFGYDGEDFLSLDLNTLTWTAAHQKAVSTKEKWEREGDPQYRKDYLENSCVVYLKKYLEYGRSALERKVPPEVSLLQKNSSSLVVCHATGFYPKPVTITWKKNGEDLYEDVELRETLPNQDGTFQRRSILTVPPEELYRNQYACIIHHSSLEKMMQIFVPSSGEVSVGAIIGVVVGVLVLFVGIAAVFIIWKKMPLHAYQSPHQSPEVQES